MKARTRKLLWATGITAAVVAIAVTLLVESASMTPEVPRAMDRDEPDLALDDLPRDELLNLDAAIDSPFSQGSAHLRYRHHVDDDVRRFGGGRADVDERGATIGLAGGQQLFSDDQVLLRLGDESRGGASNWSPAPAARNTSL